MIADASGVEGRVARIQRCHLAAEQALRRVGGEHTRWALVIQDSQHASVVEVWVRSRFIEATEKVILNTADAELAGALRHLLERIRAEPTMTPEVIFFEEGDAELAFLTSFLDGKLGTLSGAGGEA